MSKAAEARIVARAGASPAPPSPAEPGPLEIIGQNFDLAFGEIDALRARLDAIDASTTARAARALIAHRIGADGRVIVTLAGGEEEAIGFLTKGAAE